MWPDRLPLAVPLACATHADRMTWAAGVRGLREGVLCQYRGGLYLANGVIVTADKQGLYDGYGDGLQVQQDGS